MKVAHQHDIDLEGACEGTLSCCTCHLVVHPDWYDNLGEQELQTLGLFLSESDSFNRLFCGFKFTLYPPKTSS